MDVDEKVPTVADWKDKLDTSILNGTLFFLLPFGESNTQCTAQQMKEVLIWPCTSYGAS